ncbi:3-hydroxyacyl-CoA dehydrogenase NAD-binding domain-containing protein [Streptacidiphilus sp. EB129]|uniref:3-hydroxyacyl-CoA dehydrogenase NAD-binding domain-containing protein n=1 Tax=Streptacidiphilus sp. EB129 TaxID=3156262 RepID=UPI0035182DD9
MTADHADHDREVVRWEQGADGVVVLTLDDPAQSANTMNTAYLRSMGRTVDRLEAERESITGVIVTSAKKTFFAGGDLHDLVAATPEDAAAVTELTTTIKSQLRRLERLGRPVVAAVNGSALGGGLEIALACHHRIVLDGPATRLGFPEVTLGLLPGAGGVVRSVRLLGIADALLKLLLKGTQYRPGDALGIGLVHAVVPTREQLLADARAWIAANPDAAQPWDRPGHRIPGGTPSTPALAAMLPAFPAGLSKELKGAPYPAPRSILCAAVESAQVDVDTALTVEGRYFVELVCGQISSNMIKALFFDLQQANAGASRPEGHPEFRPTRVGVLGAGMMGAAIAYVCARAGVEVVLKDVTVESAAKGKGYSAALVEKAVARSRSTRERADELLARITPTADPADLAGCDLVIEAVFESVELKHRVFAETEPLVAPDALLCSNTSTLPITSLAEGVKRPEDFIGLHFFSPVDKMPLVEIIRGERTSDAALARAVDVVRLIRKTPIVVNDSRGFFTSRVIGTFLNEGLAMLAEGLSPVSIEQASLQAGYPAPVLQLLDELTLTLTRKVTDATRAAVVAEGGSWQPHPAEAVVGRMLDEFDRAGRAAGAGFYEYAGGRRGRLWPGLGEAFAVPGAGIPFEDMKERLLFIEALESVRCLDEGVLTSVADANIGSILGIGFPPWTGGVLQYVNQYQGGLAGFVARAEELAARYGDRFAPPAALVARAERGEEF